MDPNRLKLEILRDLRIHASHMRICKTKALALVLMYVSWSGIDNSTEAMIKN